MHAAEAARFDLALPAERPILSRRRGGGSSSPFSSVKMFPIANDTAHRCVALKGEQRVNVIGHEEKKCDVPAEFGVVEFRGIK
jgi:hypothetical protein